MSTSSLRIRLQFDSSLQKSPPEKCWYLIDKTLCQTVADLRKQLKRRFSLDCSKSDLQLKIDDFLLLPEENIEILRDCDLVRVSKEERSLKFEKKIKGTELKGKSKKRRREEDAGHSVKRKKEEQKEPYLYPMIFKSNEEAKNIKHNCKKENSTLRRIKNSLKEKRKKTKSECVGAPAVQSSINDIPTIEIPASVIRGHKSDPEKNTGSSKEKGGTGTKQPKVTQIKLCDKKAKEVTVKPEKLQKTGVESENNNLKDGRCETVKPKHNNNKHSNTSSKPKAINTITPNTSKGQVTTTITKKVSTFFDTSVTHSNTEGSFGENCKQNGSKLPTSRNSHVFFSSDGEEDAVCSVFETSEVIKQDWNSDKTFNVDTKKEKKKPTITELKELAFSDVYTNSSIILTNNVRKDCNGLIEPRLGNGDTCQDEVQNGLSTAQKKSVVNDTPKVTKDYTTYPNLTRTPQPGDLLAFKVIELSMSYTPELSKFKEAAVLSYDSDTKMVIVELSESSLQRSRGDGSLSRRFELDDEGEHSENADGDNERIEDRVISYDFRELVSPKLIM